MSILILDFGSQYTQLIARRVRELGVYSEIRPCNVKPDDMNSGSWEGIILSGGPSSVTDSDAPAFDRGWLEKKVPVLGVCYGMQLVTHLEGGRLGQGSNREYGPSEVEVVDTTGVFAGFEPGEKTKVWMSHGDHVDAVPSGFKVTATSIGAPIAAMSDSKRGIHCVQFHPEVVHTRKGKQILENFVFGIAKCKKNWDHGNFIEHTVERIRNEVPKNSNVICGLSGGVDSTVAAVIVQKAIGDRLTCVFVDNGLLRKDEGDQVEKALGKSGYGLNLIRVNAGNRFLEELSGVVDPEVKRKKIGHVFIEVFEKEAKKIPNVTHLVQGTLYPDVIESVSVRGPSATIKTHHNVGGLPERMHLSLVEPLRELFKDEVRAIGRALEIPEKILQRQPFPGPGLGIRVLGEVTEERLRLLREADAIFLDEIRKEGLYSSLWQSFVVLLPIQSVGVMGDYRTYESTAVLRVVTSEDGMTADWALLPEVMLRRVSNRIINEVRGINRVVLDISSKPPATIEWE